LDGGLLVIAGFDLGNNDVEKAKLCHITACKPPDLS